MSDPHLRTAPHDVQPRWPITKSGPLIRQRASVPASDFDCGDLWAKGDKLPPRDLGRGATKLRSYPAYTKSLHDSAGTASPGTNLTNTIDNGEHAESKLGQGRHQLYCKTAGRCPELEMLMVSKKFTIARFCW